MATQLCRPCRDLARRQLRVLIDARSQSSRASVAEIARNPRRHFHQSTPRREEKSQSASGPSTFAKVLQSIGSTILPKRATQPYAIFGATEAIYKACSEPVKYTISEELRKTNDVPMTEIGEELGVGGGVWHEGPFFLSFRPSAQVSRCLGHWLICIRVQNSVSPPPSAPGLK